MLSFLPSFLRLMDDRGRGGPLHRSKAARPQDERHDTTLWTHERKQIERRGKGFEPGIATEGNDRRGGRAGGEPSEIIPCEISIFDIL